MILICIQYETNVLDNENCKFTRAVYFYLTLKTIKQHNPFTGEPISTSIENIWNPYNPIWNLDSSMRLTIRIDIQSHETQ